MPKRPPIPAELERMVLIESGHRCAIPTCRQVPVELAHIVPWSRRKEHKQSNLIALCPTCHTRFDQGEIDRKSMRIYKFNLILLGSRYGDLEQRLIRRFALDPTTDEIWLMPDLEILFAFLLDDGLLEDTKQSKTEGGIERKRYKLTKKGREFINHWPQK